MDSQSESIRSVSWRDLFPWLIIMRAIPVSTGMGIIVLATLGVILAPIGWWVSSLLFVNQELMDSDYHFAEDVASQRNPFVSVFDADDGNRVDMGLVISRITGPALVYRNQTEPFYHLFHDISGLRRFCYYLFGCLWNILIWGFFGVCICRIAMLRLCRGERIGIDEAVSYGVSQLPGTLGALTLPLIAVGLLCLPMFLFGLLMTFDVGVIIAGVLWIFVLMLMLIAAILLAGLAFGWPLIVASSSAEGQGAFDSLTRCYAYAFQRPLHYLFYALIALLVGGIIWVIAARFTEGVINLSYWTASWGANVADGSRIDQVQDPKILKELSKKSVPDPDLGVDPMAASRKSEPVEGGDDRSRSTVLPPGGAGQSKGEGGDKTGADRENTEQGDGSENGPSRTLIWGTSIISFWNGLFRTIAAGFLHGLFWCLASAVYLLLRKDVDDSELDEVFLDDERRSFELPPLKNDSDNIPQVDQDAVEDPPKAVDTGNDESASESKE